MPSRILSSTSTVDHQWDPYKVLEVSGNHECVGWAPSKGRKCLHRINQGKAKDFKDLIEGLSTQPMNAVALRPQLVWLAKHGLCLQDHQYQISDMVKKWSDRIDAAAAELRSLERATRRSRTDTRSTTASSTTDHSIRTPSSHTLRLLPSTPSSSTLPAAAQSEAESIRRIIDVLHEQMRTAERRLERLNNSSSPQPTSRTVTRLSTAEIPPLHLLPSSTISAQSSVRSRRTSIISSRSPSPARSATSSSSPLSSSTSSSSAPSTPPQHTRFTHTSLLSTAPTNLPMACTITHVPRLNMSDPCPICKADEPLSKLPGAELVWCTSGCGNTFHKSCFEEWEEQCDSTERPLNCPLCRKDWSHSCACGGESNCTVVHVQRKAVDAPCFICLQSMGANQQLQWCKAGCGKNVHSECANAWADHCVELVETDRIATCTQCRAVWDTNCGC